MSWASVETKRLRKALGVPPLTLRSGIAALTSGGTSVLSGTASTWQSRLHTALTRKVDGAIAHIDNAKQADAVVSAVKSNATPLLLAGAAVAGFLLLRKR